MLDTLLIVLGSIIALLAIWNWKITRDLKLPNTFPAPPSLPIIGTTHHMWGTTNYNDDFHRMHLKYGPYYRVWGFGLEYLVVGDPKEAYKMCIDTDTWQRGDDPWEMDRRIFASDILFAIDGEKWEKRRKRLNPHFTPTKIRSFIPHINTIIEKANQILEKSQGEWIDIDNFFCSLTLDVITNYLFGEDFGCIEGKKEGNILINAFLEISKEWEKRNVVPFWLYLPHPSRITFYRSRRDLHSLVDTTIDKCAQRVKNDQKLGCVIEDLVENKYNTEIKDEVLGALFAGHDTTAHTMTWAVYHYQKCSDLQTKILKELDSVLPRGSGQIPTLEETKNFPLLKATVKECLRVYPPATAHPVVAMKDTEVAGQKILKGTTAMTMTYHLHQSPKYWDEPEKFDPTRFLKPVPMNLPADDPTVTSPMIYMPFLRGPHTCIGKYLAESELNIVLPNILSNFEFEFKDSHIEAQQYFTLRPKPPVLVKVTKRKRY